MTSPIVSFADIAHQNVVFDSAEPSGRIVLKLLCNRWIQRLRRVSQTGNSRLVYMFAEHSRFGHSLGVAYLANTLMSSLSRLYPEQIALFRNAVAAAALLHDIGHLAPGSHLAERVWINHLTGEEEPLDHEQITMRIINTDPEIIRILEDCEPGLPQTVNRILEGNSTLPEWTVAIISGDGWNADRGNWSIVDSALCAVSYGRYNVDALLDSFRLTDDGNLVLAENRVDALSHFFVARDSMYRQIYQHRVSQSADILTIKIITRLRDIFAESKVSFDDHFSFAKSMELYCDEAMSEAVFGSSLSTSLELESVFTMTEDWWSYHISRWCNCRDPILSNLSQRLRDRDLLKTIRVESIDDPFIERAKQVCLDLGFDPRYYCLVINSADLHRAKLEKPPLVLLDNNQTVPVTEIEPIIANLFQKSYIPRIWVAVPKEVKTVLGKKR